jgi:undecaprenyl-diphosphatase
LGILETILIAIVEGITEFLPVSSTGHMIIARHLLGVEDNAFTQAFIVNIQFGTILSVVVLYWKRFFQSLDFYLKLLVGVIPAIVLGLLLEDLIDAALGSVATVAVSLLLGGIVLLFVDQYVQPREEKPIRYGAAFRIGLFQCLAMIPGVSRSAATIVGGMTQGLTRPQAAEFSFFLAVPTMFGASALKLWSAWKEVPHLFEGEHLRTLLLGNIVGFLVAMLAIRFFIRFLTRHGFRLFGWYRIVVGALLLVLLALGVDLTIV